MPLDALPFLAAGVVALVTLAPGGGDAARTAPEVIA